ncbi:MAG: NAD(P)-dependent alcohol dehydrogenase [Pseudomonadota bacterium]
MKALTTTQYGGPEVVQISDVAKPTPAANDVLVRVHASAVNTGDWRIRAAAFPGVLAIAGRLMFGLRRPKNPRLGSEFAGTIEAIGSDVTRFQPGDAVFGLTLKGGASAEYMTIAEDEAVAAMPSALDFDEAAALPFGGVCALVFLEQYANVQPGQRVLVVGASGGVGTYGVQIAKALGAHVTGVASTDNLTFVKTLGADAVIDYRTTDLATVSDRFDVIFDTVGAVSPRVARRLSNKGGLFLPLNMGLREVGASLLNVLRSKKIKLAVNGDSAEDLIQLSQMVEAGTIKPVIDTIYPLENARDAHAQVEGRHRRGAIILSVAAPLNRAAA